MHISVFTKVLLKNYMTRTHINKDTHRHIDTHTHHRRWKGGVRALKATPLIVRVLMKQTYKGLVSNQVYYGHWSNVCN